MLPVRPTVYTPVAPLAIGGGVTMLLISVELWAGEIVIHLAGELDPVTGQTEVAAEFHEPWERWYRERLAGLTQGPPPQSAMERLFGLDNANLSVQDDLGTRYLFNGGRIGGTGTEWRADWHLTPGVLGEATTLTVALTGENISSSTPATLRLR